MLDSKFNVRLDEQMKKTSLILTLILVLALTSVAATVEKRVGEQIDLAWWNYPPPPNEITFDANTPFHIAHGFSCWFIVSELQYTCGPGTTLFTLEVDGKEMIHSFLDVSFTSLTYGDLKLRYRENIWIFNFPEGMEGTHPFTAKWWKTCFWIEGKICEKPNEMVVDAYNVVTIHFVEP